MLTVWRLNSGIFLGEGRDSCIATAFNGCLFFLEMISCVSLVCWLLRSLPWH